MNKKILIFLAAIMLFATYCNKDEESTSICDECDGILSEEETMWVNSELNYCNGESGEKCLMVQYETVVNENEWEVFEEDICGFDFVEGYLYRLELKIAEEKDASGNKVKKYCLIRVISETKVYL